jgi:hypothetical protein
MPTYPPTIRRCQHIKVNGVQCGSPAKRNEMHCFFHEQCRLMSRDINMRYTEHGIIKLPTLEDANSIQLGLAEVMRLLVTHQIDHRIASLLLRALRTAAANVRFTSLEPKPTHVVIDPKCVENRPLGATAWSTAEGQEYDYDNDNDNNANPQDVSKDDVSKDKDHVKKSKDKVDNDTSDEEGRQCLAKLTRLTEGIKHDPDFLDRPHRFPAAPAEASRSPTPPENRYHNER